MPVLRFLLMFYRVDMSQHIAYRHVPQCDLPAGGFLVKTLKNGDRVCCVFTVDVAVGIVRLR